MTDLWVKESIIIYAGQINLSVRNYLDQCKVYPELPLETAIIAAQKSEAELPGATKARIDMAGRTVVDAYVADPDAFEPEPTPVASPQANEATDVSQPSEPEHEATTDLNTAHPETNEATDVSHPSEPDGRQDTLDTVGKQIGVHVRKLETFEKETFDRQDAITALLQDARSRVERGEAGDIGFEKWCEQNVKRSYRDIQRLLAFARSPDPAGARTLAREKNRLEARASRERKRRERSEHGAPSSQKQSPVTTPESVDPDVPTPSQPAIDLGAYAVTLVSEPEHDPVEAIMELWNDLSFEQKDEVKDRIRAAETDAVKRRLNQGPYSGAAD